MPGPVQYGQDRRVALETARAISGLLESTLILPSVKTQGRRQKKGSRQGLLLDGLIIIENGGEESEIAEILSRNIISCRTRLVPLFGATVWCHLGAMTIDKENHMLDAAKCTQGAVRTGLWIPCQHQVLIRTTRQTLLYWRAECMFSIFEDSKTTRLV